MPSPFSKGLSSIRRKVFSGARRLGAPSNARYVLTETIVSLPNSVEHPNIGTPTFAVRHDHKQDFTNVGTNTHDQIDTHISGDGSDHSFIDQDVTSASTPTFTGTNITGVPAANILAGTFGTGNYTFDADLTVDLDLLVKVDAQVDGQILMKDGANSSPALSFANDPDTGIRGIVNNLIFITDGKFRASFDNSARFRMGNAGTTVPVIVLDADSNTGMGWGATDELVFYAGGVEFLTLDEGTQDELIVNENGVDIDFRIEGDADVNLFFTEASTDSVGIGLAAPLGKLHVDQASTTGAIPVLFLDQADVDEDYFKIIGTSDTSADRALVDAADFTTPGSIAGWLKINVQDDQATNPITDGDYYIPFYSVPTA